MRRRKRPGQSTRGASWGIRSAIRSARCSTIPISSWPAWSATARRRPVPLATAWHSNKFLNPATDGAVLPILHLNGYKIANPTILARITREELEQLLRGYGWTPYFVEGHEPAPMHEAMSATLDVVVEEIKKIQQEARAGGNHCAPPLADDRAEFTEGLDRAESDRRRADRGEFSFAPGAALRSRGQSRASQDARGMAGELPARELFDEQGRLKPELAELAPAGSRRMGANPHANGGILLRDLRMPDFCNYAVDVPEPGARGHWRHARARAVPARRGEAQSREPEFPRLRPRRDGLQRPRSPLPGDLAPVGGRDCAGRRIPRARRAA